MNAALCECESQTAMAFDSLAPVYDELFTRSMIGRAQRGAVWDVLREDFEPGSHILELNCGTGEDALFLAAQGMSVVACDASQKMIEIARQRQQREDPGAPIEFEWLATEQLSELRPADLFDGALSNFSGLNCVSDLDRAARSLASMLFPGASVFICLSTRFCLLEMLWFLSHGDFRKAFRRTSGIATAKVGQFRIKVRYPTLREVKKQFSPSFKLLSCTGIGVAVPPSYLEPIVARYPRLLGWLCQIDKHVSRLPLFRILGDHMLLHFERVEGTCW